MKNLNIPSLIPFLVNKDRIINLKNYLFKYIVLQLFVFKKLTLLEKSRIRISHQYRIRDNSGNKLNFSIITYLDSVALSMCLCVTPTGSVEIVHVVKIYLKTYVQIRWIQIGIFCSLRKLNYMCTWQDFLEKNNIT